METTCSQCGGPKTGAYNQCRPCKAAYARQYRKEHPDKIRTLNQEYYSTHKDEHAAYNQLWQAANRERVRENQRRWRENNAEHVLAYQQAYAERGHDTYLQKKYGITLAEYKALLDRQNGLCAMCHLPPLSNQRLAVDHDHCTGLVRGLLHVKCNAAIGLLNDDAELLQAGAEYLKLMAPG